MTVHVNPKFDDLPIIVLPSYQYPEHDGDMAELHELADRVLEHPARAVAKLAHRYQYHLLQDTTGIYPMQIVKAWHRAEDELQARIRGVSGG